MFFINKFWERAGSRTWSHSLFRWHFSCNNTVLRLTSELLGFILDFRVSYGDLSRSYQELALRAELCGPLSLYKMEGVGFEPTQP